MDEQSRSDAAVDPAPTAAAAGPAKPGPCAPFLVSGALLTLLGAVVLWFGVAVYLENTWHEGTGKVSVAVLGALVLVAGLTTFICGLARAAAALDHLVRQSS